MATIVCDVRVDLREGREPFYKIMSAISALGPDDELELWATFEPIPLYQVLARQGFGHRTEQSPEGDWRVTFYRAEPAEPAEPTGG